VIKLELDTGGTIILTGKLEKDYLLTAYHEEIHKRINHLFKIETRIRYGLNFNEKGAIMNSTGGSLPLYPFPNTNYLSYFKYILLELFHFIYEFLFALFFDLKEFIFLKDWFLTFYNNVIALCPIFYKNQEKN
jgi:hypothetical protein